MPLHPYHFACREVQCLQAPVVAVEPAGICAGVVQYRHVHDLRHRIAVEGSSRAYGQMPFGKPRWSAAGLRAGAMLFLPVTGSIAVTMFCNPRLVENW